MLTAHWLALGCTATGAAIGSLTWILVDVLTSNRGDADRDSFERERRRRIRSECATYRWFEPLVDALARASPASLPAATAGERDRGRAAGAPPSRRPRDEALESLRRHLPLMRRPLPWTAEEFMAVSRLQAVPAGLAGALFGWLLEEPLLAFIAGLGCFVGFPILNRSTAAEQAGARIGTVTRRLPYAIDLMALMMEAGASFLESLETVVADNRGHPLSEELDRVLRDVAAGRSRPESLEALADRLGDPDVTELVFAINKGEELGTPLTKILGTAAEQMRLKRYQWLEKATAQAQVQIVFPGMITMIASLVVVVAPFVLKAYLSQP